MADDVANVVAAADAADVAFTVLDVLGGFARLTKRTPTLDGAVPVRVAQGCVPLLQGNAYGFQVTLTRKVTVRRGFAGVRLDADLEDVERLRRANVPRLHAEGILDGRGPLAPLAGRVAWIGRGSRLRLFTGLLLRPEAGVFLRVTSAANRRNTSVDVDEEWIPDDAGFVPLVLSIRVRREATLVGEVACVGPLRSGVRMAGVALREAPETAEAHVAFYDQAYFDTKKTEVSLKYRRQVAREKAPKAVGEACGEVVEAGPVDWSVVPAGPFAASPKGSGSRPPLESAVFRSPLAFSALYDGHTLAIDVDEDELARDARAVERTFTEAMGADFVGKHRGALWYLTKLFTPHPPGEPHFFVKPWAFTRTPAGWSSLLDGIHGDGFDVLRGVVSTDSFFATPAVFRVTREGTAIRVRKGQPLLRVVPVPRQLLTAGFHVEALPPL